MCGVCVCVHKYIHDRLKSLFSFIYLPWAIMMKVVEPLSPGCDTVHNSINGSRIQLNTVVHPMSDTICKKPVESSCNDIELSGSSSNSPSEGDIRKTALEGGHFESECDDTMKQVKVSFSEDKSHSLTVPVDNGMHQCDHNL